MNRISFNVLAERELSDAAVYYELERVRDGRSVAQHVVAAVVTDKALECGSEIVRVDDDVAEGVVCQDAHACSSLKALETKISVIKPALIT